MPYKFMCRGRFQPTLPEQGATPVRLRKLTQQRDFNPRSPHGERPHAAAAEQSAQRFQSTFPARRATIWRSGGRFRLRNFNPRSPHGERQRLAKSQSGQGLRGAISRIRKEAALQNTKTFSKTAQSRTTLEVRIPLQIHVSFGFAPFIYSPPRTYKPSSTIMTCNTIDIYQLLSKAWCKAALPSIHPCSNIVHLRVNLRPSTTD